jgi:hypothetical protein
MGALGRGAADTSETIDDPPEPGHKHRTVKPPPGGGTTN